MGWNPCLQLEICCGCYAEPKIQKFWTNTETYEALQVYIDLNLDGLKEAILKILVGESYRIDTGSFQNDMTSFKNKDDFLTLPAGI